MELKIEYMNPADLVPYEGNARSHAEEDVSAIVESIKAFGFNDPIGIWKGNLIIEGHGRLLAAQELGLEKVPVIHLDHLTDVERRAYALAHNKTAELSRWDAELLSLELCNIQDIDMSVFGFETGNTEEQSEPKEAAFNDNCSLIVEFETETEAEELFTRLSEEGYKCRLSTL